MSHEENLQKYYEDDSNEELQEIVFQYLLKLSPDGEDENAAVIQDVVIELTRRANINKMQDDTHRG